VAIEGMHLADEAQDAQILSQVLKDTERLQTALLNSISHDLRTPLVSIIGVLSSLQEEGMGLDEAAKRSMIQVARDEAERLNRLITNLLDVSRIEAGAMKVDRHPADVQEIVGAALEQLGEQARKRTIKLSVPPDLPFISLDSGLMVQALFNVIDNAIKYSPEGSPVEIAARQEGHDVVIAVADVGPGIPEKDRTHVFDKFYRIQRPDKVTGTGLGLSICKGIVEAHGGRVAAENRIGGGTIIAITLPIKDPKGA
jgi:two-component system sensor histidine kinase KdpD